MRSSGWIVGTAALTLAVGALAQAPSEQTDKYAWLGDIHGEKSMEWVKAENARTAAVLEKQNRLTNCVRKRWAF